MRNENPEGPRLDAGGNGFQTFYVAQVTDDEDRESGEFDQIPGQTAVGNETGFMAGTLRREVSELVGARMRRVLLEGGGGWTVVARVLGDQRQRV